MQSRAPARRPAPGRRPRDAGEAPPVVADTGSGAGQLQDAAGGVNCVIANLPGSFIGLGIDLHQPRHAPI